MLSTNQLTTYYYFVLINMQILQIIVARFGIPKTLHIEINREDKWQGNI